ncbi:hypothetical protein IMSAGC007_01523 [Lachnospiraceae bacterium]|nr:hypothetical protein IMSAGC007_01523 [Lachnospiraceae bacterium]
METRSWIRWDYTNTYAADRANGSSSLNGDSQAYLNSLKEKYPDVNIMVADFKNGKVSYWMVGRSKDTIENPGTVYKEKVQKQIAEKRAKKKEEEALKEKKLAKAESVEKLMEQIKAGTSQPVKVQEEGKDAQLDLTI